MDYTKNTISDVLKQLVLDIDNMNSFLFSLQNILESKSENVDITQKTSDGNGYTIAVPSFGYLKGKIEDINSRFDTLISTNSDVIGIKSANGDVRKFELKKTSTLLADLEKIQNTSITLPTEFRVKNNFFFESFLNPLLYVNLDISSVLTDDIDSFVVKRIIINSVNNEESTNYYNNNYKGKNDIDLTTLLDDLNSNSIDYFEDDNIVDVEVAVNKIKGSFDVIRILEDESTQTLGNGQNTTIVRRRYKLNTLNYTDVLSGVKNSKILSEGNVLITDNDSEYVIKTVDKTNTEVVLERIFGIDPITIGANMLRMKPQPYRTPELQVNVGFNEQEIIFIRPISKSKNLTVDDYSKGVSIVTNDLTIPLPDNTITTLEKYYNNFVSDFGLILLNLAKERKLPAILAKTPSAPALSADNFSVIQIDRHIQEDTNTKQLNDTIKEKVKTENDIQELNKKIEDLKTNITTVSKTPQESKRLEKQLTEAQKTRDEKTVNLSTLVTNLTVKISTTPQFINKKKYSVRGFWQIPSAISTAYGTQSIAQFKYRFRYLSQTGTQPNAEQQTFIDIDGAKKSATFSPWTEQLTKPRSKKLDETTGLYYWIDENITDSEEVNSNQLDIPIRKGEIVEIQVKSLSEAGWPDNSVESDWSNPVQVSFPESITSEEEASIITQKTFAQKAQLDFEKSLITRGLDTHLASQFTKGERFFSHKAEDIASGFYTTEGNVIDLYEKLKSVQSTLDAITQSITLDRGVIKISIIDPDGNSVDVSNGDTVSLFAGYYKDQIKDTTGGTTIYNEGKIISKQYILSIQNTSATPLELITLLYGGIDQISDISNPSAYPDSDYHVNRRYDIVPFGVNKNPVPLLGAIKQIASEQSAQVKSQYVNARVKNYGLSEELYFPSTPSTDYLLAPSYSSTYYGQTINGSIIPYNWGHYLPFDPQNAPYGSSNSKIWNGTTNSSSIGVGGGLLTEFCISKDHPSIKQLCGPNYTYSAPNILEIFRPNFTATTPPTIDLTATQQILPFSHALHFETSIDEDQNIFGVKYYKQASRITPNTPTSNATKNDSHYPIKLGFTKNDEYLVGKYTCGAYLYMFPNNYESVSVEGNFQNRSTKQVKLGTENSINIPILFQFRCSDKLGYIGGYRTGSTLNNIKYQKKMGIDIIIKDNSPFSFDLEISSQYIKETSLDSPLVQGRGIINTF
jgi:hypothetical protein